MARASAFIFEPESAASFICGIQRMAKNYYAILGVLPNATPEDIRDAYLRRAKELHPDHYGENSRPFLEMQEAYNVLSDPGHRSSYDRSLKKTRLYSNPQNPSEIETLRPGRHRADKDRGSKRYW